LLWSYGENLVAQGDEPLARSHWAEGLRICQELGDIWRAAGLMGSVAELAARSGETTRLEKAARIWGSAEALLTARGDVAFDAKSIERDIATARAQLGEARFEAAWAEGQVMTINEAIDYALAVLAAASTGERLAVVPMFHQVTKQQFGGLTKREREITALVAQGKSNREIAQTLVLSEYTVASHVSNILSKLEFSSRTQIVGWAIEKGLAQSHATR
jgi:DNA-binding CsgD family transcriptional regulator